LNGKSLTKNYIHYNDIVNGGTVCFEMGNEPDKTRCTEKSASPFSLSLEL
jgi:putative alpha-1,2-mannosidase